MIGAPGSGKSTWANTFIHYIPNFTILCPDTARGKFGKDENDQSVSAIAFEYIRKKANEELTAGNNIIIDATNINKKRRKQWLDIARQYNTITIAIVLHRSIDILLSQNKKRAKNGGRNVPSNIINRMVYAYEGPTNTEFDYIFFN